MNERSDVARRVCELVRQISPSKSVSIEEHHHLIDDLRFDSVAFLELAVSLESEFDLPPITPEQTRSVSTVGQLLNAVEGMVNDLPK
jgi:acyl carrier protein